MLYTVRPIFQQETAYNFLEFVQVATGFLREGHMEGAGRGGRLEFGEADKSEK